LVVLTILISTGSLVAGNDRAEKLSGAIGRIVRLEAGHYRDGRNMPAALAKADSLFSGLLDNFEAEMAADYVAGGEGGIVGETVAEASALNAPSGKDPAGAITAALRASDAVAAEVKPLLDGYGAAFLLNLEGRRKLRARLGIVEVLLAAGLPITLADLGLDRADSAGVKQIAEEAGQGSADKRGSEAYLYYSTMLDLDDLGGRFGHQQSEKDLADRLMSGAEYAGMAAALAGLSRRTIVFLGDSQTDNRHWSSPAHYPKVIEEVFRRINSSVRVHNAGVGGDDSGEGLERLESDVLSSKPDMCFVLFGGNDCAHWGREHSSVSPEQYRKNIEEIVVRLKAADCRPVLISYPTIPAPAPQFGLKSATVLGKMNERQAAVRENHNTGWIELAGLFAAHDSRRMFAVDLIHYSPEAHVLLAERILRFLADGE
jgi:lysophospholipase L1-like esterase